MKLMSLKKEIKILLFRKILSARIKYKQFYSKLQMNQLQNQYHKHYCKSLSNNIKSLIIKESHKIEEMHSRIRSNLHMEIEIEICTL